MRSYRGVGAVEKYLGTAYDKVKEVHENLEDILKANAVLEYAVGFLFFEYIAEAGQVLFTGPDSLGRPLQISQSINPVVFVNRQRVADGLATVESNGTALRLTFLTNPGDLVQIAPWGLNEDGTVFFDLMFSNEEVNQMLADALAARNEAVIAASSATSSASSAQSGASEASGSVSLAEAYANQAGDAATLAQSLANTLPSRGRNKLFNGNFDLWQRGASLTAAASIRYLADRWRTASNGSTIAPSRQAFTLGQTTVPGEPSFFHRAVVVSSAGAGSYAVMAQLIESVRTLAGRTAKLSFWAKADAPKNIAADLSQSFGSGGSPSTAVDAIGAQLVALTTSWQKFELDITLPSLSGKTIGSDGGDFLQTRFWFDAGSNNTAGSANLGQQSGTFDIAQVQLEEGSVATPFEELPIADELARCQRYYNLTRMLLSSTVSGTAYNQLRHPVQMRSTPTFVVSPDTGTGAVVIGDKYIVSQSVAHSSNTGALVTCDAEL